MTRLVCFRLHLQDMPLQIFVVVETDLRLEERSFFGRQTVKAGVYCNYRRCCGLECHVAQQYLRVIARISTLYLDGPDVICGIVLLAPFCILFET